MSVPMRVEPLVTDEGVAPWLADEWGRFVRRSSAGWWWHTPEWLQYQRVYASSSVDYSFAVLDSERHAVVAVVPLVYHYPTRTFSFTGHPLPAPIAANPMVLDVVDEHVLSLGHIAPPPVWVGNVFFTGHHEVSPGGVPQATPTGETHWVVPVAGGPSWSDVRKSYHSLIRRAQKNFTIECSTGGRAEDLFLAYRRLHRMEYREPRAEETYTLQQDWLRDFRALVCVARSGDVIWGAAYWYVFKGFAYYGSGVYASPDGVGHAVVWTSLVALAQMGVTLVDMGTQGVGNSEKDQNIDFFKRGFGGMPVSVRTRRL